MRIIAKGIQMFFTSWDCSLGGKTVDALRSARQFAA